MSNAEALLVVQNICLWYVMFFKNSMDSDPSGTLYPAGGLFTLK